MITLTNNAINHLESLIKDTNKVEFAVEGGGCSGLNYKLNFTDRELDLDDKVFEFGKIQLLVPYEAYMYLEETEVDWSDDLLNGGFKFNNPQAERSCGCGTSFSV